MAERKRRNPAPKPSITGHRLFPLIVALWFGALFGLVSLAIRASLIERLVLALGIQHVIPMAAPPLGGTARVLIALLLAVAGCIVGAVIGRALAAGGKGRQAPPSSSTTNGSTDSESAGEDFAAPSLIEDDAHETEAQDRRRRQLAIMHSTAEDDDAEEDTVSNDPQILSVSELPLKSFDEIDNVWLHDSERSRQSRAATPKRDDAAIAVEVDEPARVIEAEIEKAPAVAPAQPPFDAYASRLNAAAEAREDEGPGFISVPHVEPVETGTLAAMEEPKPSPKSVRSPDGSAAHRIATAPLDELSHVELLERLALTIARRRAQQASAPAQPSSTPPAEPVAGAPAPDDAEVLQQGYSSLQSVFKPSAAPLPHEAPPRDSSVARPFDAPKAREDASDQTEQALHAALATLRRMSGAA